MMTISFTEEDQARSVIRAQELLMLHKDDDLHDAINALAIHAARTEIRLEKVISKLEKNLIFSC